MELNGACSTLEDIFGDLEEISDAMERINAVIYFLYEQEQQERSKNYEPKLTARHNMTELDYYDSEKSAYMIAIKGDEQPIYQTMTIIDDNMEWNCWLKYLSYNKQTNTYSATYKPF